MPSNMGDMMEHVSALAALCSPQGAAAGWLLLAGMLAAGLAGSVVHCSLMCGPLVLAQVGARLQRVPAARLCEHARLREAVLAPYHIGRITTYAAIGAAAASLGLASRLWVNSALGWLLLLGAMLFILQAAGRLRPGFAHGQWIPRAASGWLQPLRRLAARMDVTRPGGALLLGLVLGGLPCMFLYSAVAVAAAAGSAAGGALAMVAFGLGTVPALVIVGIAGHRAGLLWNGAITRFAPVLLLFNGGILGLLALRSLLG